MADLGQALITKIVVEEDLTTAVSAGIKPDWFENADHRKVYQWMLDYFSRYGETPTAEALEAEYPNYELRKRVTEPFEYYIDKFRALRERAILVDGVIDANAALDEDDTVQAQQHINRALVRLGQEVSPLQDENAVEGPQERYNRYRQARRTPGKLTGVATGFPTIDFKTGGFQKQQFVLMGGQPKQGKSFMLMVSAIAAHDAGKKVLFLSFEMSKDEQLARYDAMTCGINVTKLLLGISDEEDLKRLRKGMGMRRRMQPFIVSADISATTTVSGLAAKIEQHKPDIIFVDGVYLMENEIGAEPGSPRAYTSISRGLKRLAQRANIPLVGTTQALSAKVKGGGEVTMHSLGWTSAWSQDTDLLIGVEGEPDSRLIKVRIVAGRHVSPCVISVTCNWEESLFEEYDLDDDEEDDED